MRLLIVLIGLFAIQSTAFAVLQLGKKPVDVTLADDDGGRVAGGSWSSSEIKNKVYVLFYVDPDENETNDHVSAALKKEGFDLTRFGSIAVINMAATWKPNFAINSVLKKRQEAFPNTIYVKDLHKTLVKQWQLADDSSDIVAFDKTGNVIFAKDGKLTEADVSTLIGAIRKSL